MFVRPLTASTKLGCTASLLFLPTIFRKLLWVASTYLRLSSVSWRAPCIPATSSCVLTHVSPTCPNQGKNNQVGNLFLSTSSTLMLLCSAICFIPVLLLMLASLTCYGWLLVLDRGWSCLYDSGQPGGRQEDSTSLWERPGAARGQ